MKTNRRKFIKGVTGFIAGIYAVFVPKAKADEWTHVVATYNGKGNSDGIEIYPRRSGTKFIAELPKFQTNCAIGVAFVAKDKEMTVYIDGKKATKAKDGSYRI